MVSITGTCYSCRVCECDEMTAGVWKEKDPEKRKANELAIKQNETTQNLDI